MREREREQQVGEGEMEKNVKTLGWRISARLKRNVSAFIPTKANSNFPTRLRSGFQMLARETKLPAFRIKDSIAISFQLDLTFE